MTSSPHGPYDQGFTRHTMVGTEGSQAARRSQSHKTDRSPDCTLQLECMKSESLVIAGQHTAVNTQSILRICMEKDFNESIGNRRKGSAWK